MKFYYATANVVTGRLSKARQVYRRPQSLHQFLSRSHDRHQEWQTKQPESRRTTPINAFLKLTRTIKVSNIVLIFFPGRIHFLFVLDLNTYTSRNILPVFCSTYLWHNLSFEIFSSWFPKRWWTHPLLSSLLEITSRYLHLLLREKQNPNYIKL